MVLIAALLITLLFGATAGFLAGKQISTWCTQCGAPARCPSCKVPLNTAFIRPADNSIGASLVRTANGVAHRFTPADR